MPQASADLCETIARHAAARFAQQHRRVLVRSDRLFVRLLIFEWLAGIVVACWLSPWTWSGPVRQAHLHVWAAALLGGAIITVPILLALTRPGRVTTRHAIAASQMLMAALLIHFTGGRIETHFLVFGSLAFLASYRDWRVLVTASAVVAADHFLRGIYWPQSVYGVLSASPWRWLEHAGWVVFEDVFLIVFCVQGVREMRQDAEGQAQQKAAEQALQQAEGKYRSIFENAVEGMFQTTPDGRLIAANPVLAHMFGYPSPQELIANLSEVDLNYVDPRRRLEYQRILEEEEVVHGFEYQVYRKDATKIWVSENARAVRDADGVLLRYEGSLQDITQRKAAEEALCQSKQRFESLVQNASDVITILGVDGDLHYLSPAVERAWGYSPETLQGKNAFELVHLDDLAAARTLFHQACARPGVNLTSGLRVRHADGSWRSCEVILNNLLGEPGVNGIVVTYRDVTERKAFEEQLAHQAFHDSLSGLPNRALFMDRLHLALVRARRQEAAVAVIFLDLDNFKIINDSLGHEAGDRLLIAVTERLRACVRPGDTVARLGGDEFTLLLEDLSDVSDALVVAERIAEQLQVPIRLQGREVFTTGSIGIAVSTGGCDQPDGLLRDADTAMYQAKTDGKARYVVFDRSMNTRAVERLELESDLRRALENGEFQVHYQPIVRLETGEVREVEALVRWQHPQQGLVSPAKFIPIAEETGLIIALGRWVLEEACRQARMWQTQRPGDPPLVVSVNLSARQLQDADLVEEISGILQETGLEATSLKLEITESMMMQDAEATIGKLHQLKDLGVRLAVDDFGTGYSSMAYLSSFPIDTLKIDRSFVTRLGQHTEDGAIVRAIVNLAKTLNLHVTSEGIETAEQLVQLQALGCDQGQGYYFSRPLTSTAVTALLATSQLACDGPEDARAVRRLAA